MTRARSVAKLLLFCAAYDVRERARHGRLRAVYRRRVRCLLPGPREPAHVRQGQGRRLAGSRRRRYGVFVLFVSVFLSLCAHSLSLGALCLCVQVLTATVGSMRGSISLPDVKNMSRNRRKLYRDRQARIFLLFFVVITIIACVTLPVSLNQVSPPPTKPAARADATRGGMFHVSCRVLSFCVL